MFKLFIPLISDLESTQALALPKATSHFCRSWGDGALKYMCCWPGITKSSLVVSMLFTGKVKCILFKMFIHTFKYLPNRNQYERTIDLAYWNFDWTFTALTHLILRFIVWNNSVFQDKPSGLPTCNLKNMVPIWRILSLAFNTYVHGPYITIPIIRPFP